MHTIFSGGTYHSLFFCHFPLPQTDVRNVVILLMPHNY